MTSSAKPDGWIKPMWKDELDDSRKSVTLVLHRNQPVLEFIPVCLIDPRVKDWIAKARVLLADMLEDKEAKDSVWGDYAVTALAEIDALMPEVEDGE